MLPYEKIDDQPGGPVPSSPRSQGAGRASLGIIAILRSYWFNALALQCLLYFYLTVKWLNSRYLAAPSEEEGSCEEREGGLQNRYVCPDDPPFLSGEGDRRALGDRGIQVRMHFLPESYSSYSA